MPIQPTRMTPMVPFAEIAAPLAKMKPFADIKPLAKMEPMKRLPTPPADADIIAAGGSVSITATGGKVITLPTVADALRESDPLAALPVRCEVYCVGGYSL
jgi:hypothetical protein